MALASDAFTRADSAVTLGTADVGGAWTVSGTWGVQTNRGYKASSTAGSIAVLACTVADQIVSADMGVFSTNFGVLGRSADGNNFYLAQALSGGNVQLFKCVATVFTQLGSTVAGGAATGKKLSLSCIGSTIQVLVDGVSKISVTDTTFPASAFVGMRDGNGAGSTNRFDNFLAEAAPVTVAGGMATVTSTALAGSVAVSQTVAGGMATVTATVLAGAVLLGSTIAGGQATETDTAQAGLVVTGNIIVGGQVTVTSTALAGTVVGAGLIVGGQATETDTALAGTVAQFITGGQAGDTSTALAGTVRYTVLGGQAGETITVLAGTTGETVVVGGQVTETDTALAGTVDKGYIDGDASNSDDGLFIDGTALVEWEPTVVSTPSRYQNILAMDTARAIQLTGIGPAGQPLITHSTKTVQRARDRILVGGLDVTYFRDVKTPTPDYRLIKPLLWGSATLVLPQVNPQYERLGDDGTVPVLKKIKADALVVVQRVLDDEVIATDYVGFIDAINTSGSVLSLTLGGHASGRASNDIEPPPVFRAKHDMKFQVLNYLQTLNLHTASTDAVIGIPIHDRGGSDGLTLVNELVSLAVTSDGDTFDVMPDEDRVYDMTPTDRETIHATVYLDDALATQQLDRAFSEESNIVYASGRTASGQVVNNAKAPGLVQYPLEFGGDLELGAGPSGVVLALNSQLSVTGYLNYEDSDSPSVFDLDTYYAVVEFQSDAGLPVTGVVDEATWNALWNFGLDLGWTVAQARIHPMAQRSYTRKFNFAGNGSKTGENPEYDPHRIKRAVSIEVGSGFNRRRIKRFARSRLAPEDVSNWQGTLSLPSGVIAGEHTPGDPITADDVMPARALRPGMNLWMPLFDGGTLFHIVTADVTNDGANVELHIDTQARDSIPLWEVISRNRETKSSPARRVSGQVRSSQIMQDSVADWTDICGIIPAQQPLFANQWNGVAVPAGQEGVINTIRIQLADEIQFSVLLTEKIIPGGPQIDTPLVDPRPSERPWNERPGIMDPLRDEYGALGAWGTPEQPCGYGHGLKTDDLGATGTEPTGLFYEDAGFNYSAAEPGRLYLWIWVGTNTFLEPGKILEQQLTPP